MIRVLQCVNDMRRAGLETMLMNYYRHIDKEKIQFDFLTHRSKRSDYDDEIESLGGRIYYAPRLHPQNYPAYFKFMRHLFKEHPEYRIVHSHIDSMSYLPLLAAKWAGVPIRIAHSHNTSIDKDFKYLIKHFFRLLLVSVANCYCACGKEAGEYLFPGKVVDHIPNSVNVDKFMYSKETRISKRSELAIENKLVIGHVGRLSYQKNHTFLLKVFKKISELNPNAVLILVGVGEREKIIRNQVHELSIQDRVIFLGKRSDVNELYQAMDVFVMQSLFEGVPVVGIEAQFSGLPCIFSTRIPQEVKFSGKVSFLDLSMSSNVWAKEIIVMSSVDREECIDLANSRFNIEVSSKLLENYYLHLSERI